MGPPVFSLIFVVRLMVCEDSEFMIGMKLKWYKLLAVNQRIVSSSLTIPATKSFKWCLEYNPT